MNIQMFKKVLPSLMRNNVVPFVWGLQGVGKTQTVQQIAAENNMKCIVLHCATQEVGDLIGLLTRDSDSDTVYHARPEWFPTEADGPTIVFLDELNRAPQDVLQALFSFITHGTLHRHQLPKGCHIVAAGNYASDSFTVTDTSDAAWLSRFCHLDFKPTAEEWIAYAEKKDMFDLAAFMREQPTLLETSGKKAESLDTSFITPDRRAWTDGVGRLLKDENFPEGAKYEVFSGLVGPAAAAAFQTWMNKQEKAFNLNHILQGYNGKIRARVRELTKDATQTRGDLLNQPIDELFVKIEANPELLSAVGFLDNLKLFLLDLPKELSTKAFVRLGKIGKFHGRKELLFDPDYVIKFAPAKEAA